MTGEHYGGTMRELRPAWTLDRDAARRTEDCLLETLAAQPATHLVFVDARGRVCLDAPGIWPDLPDHGLTPPSTSVGYQESGAGEGGLRLPDLHPGDCDLTGLEVFYLGRLVPVHGWDRPGRVHERDGEAQAAAWIGVVLPEESVTAPTDAEGACQARPDLVRIERRYPRSALRAVAAHLSVGHAQVATAAVALASWHARARYCTRCGARTHAVQAGWAQRCTGCGDVSFPRTDPAVIMAVTDREDRIVLVHGAAWQSGRYSTVAGFVEAGESAEAAVVREVAEETGLRVEEVEPVRTQPWPYPRSLMLAYRARLVDGALLPRADGEEVTDVLVLSRRELAQAVAQGRVVLPGPASVARWLIEDWFGGPVTASCD